MILRLSFKFASLFSELTRYCWSQIIDPYSNLLLMKKSNKHIYVSQLNSLVDLIIKLKFVLRISTGYSKCAAPVNLLLSRIPRIFTERIFSKTAVSALL